MGAPETICTSSISVETDPSPSVSATPAERRGDSISESSARVSAPRALVQAAGLSFLILGFLGRVPAAFNQLGILLIVSASGRGLTAAGAAVAAVGLGTAVGAPLMGRAVDRFGPVRVLAAAMSVQVIALLGVIVGLSTGASTAAILGCAALLGAANPQVASIARACWSGIARRQGEHLSLRTIRLGFGFETAADETSYVIGPVAAGLLVTFLGPLGAAGALLGCTVLFEGAFALWLARRREIWTGGRTAADSSQVTVPLSTLWHCLAPCLVAIFATGMVFGATQTALTAINEATGNPALTGPMYGAMGVTSALAGLVAPSLSWSWRRKMLLSGTVVALCSSLIAALPGTLITLGAMLVMGGAVGNTLATAYTTLEGVAPASRMTTVMTIAATCLVLGVSSGSVAAGLLGANLHLANAAAVVSGLIVLAVSFALPRPKSAQN